MIRRSVVATLFTGLCALVGICAGVSAATALPQVRWMPKYAVRGEVVDDPVELKSERKAFQASFDAYKLAAREYQNEVKEFITREIGLREKSINFGYKGQIDALDQAQFDLRREAIARLESFVRRHQDHDQYTPDTLFRLAELYYEDTIASDDRAQDDFQRQMNLYNRGKILDPPVDTERDFSRSVAIYKYLHWVPEGTAMTPLSGKLEGVVLEKRWPKYKFADAAMYLQGFCELKAGDIERSVATLSEIENHYPNSTYISEAWLRVGEMRFDDGDFEKAADAYGRAASRAQVTNDDVNYMLALYKLGWSYFQLYKYPDAVRWFQKLIEYEVDHADKLSAKAKQLNLRKEAVEYLAKSLAEPSWDDDGCDDFGNEDTKTVCVQRDPRLRPRLYVSSVLEPKFDDFPNWKQGLSGEALQRLEANFAARAAVRRDLVNGKPYVYDILVTYGNTLYEQAVDDYYRQAVLVLGYVVDNYSTAREAQGLQRKVIRSVDILAAAALGYQSALRKDPNNDGAKLGLAMAMLDQDRQIVERRKYLTLFSKGTPWYDKWGSDKDLAAQVDDTVMHVRLDFAQLIHVQAQTLRAAGDEEGALAKYAEAAKEYEVLLLADTQSPGAYDLAWTLADTLFFAGKRCDALRTDKGELLRGPTTELVTYPADAMPSVRRSCELMKKSVQYYNMVRDWKGQKTRGEDGKPLDYAEQAGFSAIVATSLVLNARASYPRDDADHIETRMLPELRPSSAQDDADLEANKDATDVVPVTPQSVDAAAVDWLQAVDGYIASGQFNAKDPERQQRLALQAAELLYKNRHFDDWKEGATDKIKPDFWSARERLWWIVKKYPSSTQANEAIKDLLTSYGIERQFAKLQETAKYMEDHNLGTEQQRTVTFKAVQEFNLGVLGRGADAIYAKAEETVKTAEASADPAVAGAKLEEARADYDKAGDTYRSLRAKAPDTKVQLSALMNGMRSYLRAEKWEKCFDVLREAEQMIRDVKTTDKEEQKKNIERIELIVTTRADLNYKFFNIPEAIADYRTLYASDPTGPKSAEYLKSAADLASSNGNWDLAVQLDQQIIAKFEKDPSPKRQELVRKSAWRIQQSWQKKGDVDKQLGALDDFIKRFIADKTVSNRVFQAYSMMAEIEIARGDKKASDKIWGRILDSFTKGGFPRNGGPEATAAAQATFELMRPRYDAFMATKLVENTKLVPAKRVQDLQKQVMAMMDVVFGPTKKVKKPDGTTEDVRGGGMFDEYANTVASFASQNWSYAAFLYRAKILQYFARTIYAAPKPDNLSEDEEAAYEEALEGIGRPIENQAMKSLEVALKDAESKGVVNSWVTELRKAINQYKPAEYPLLKDEKRLVADPVGTLPIADKESR